MANKRMFSRDVVQSDAFLDMPVSTQALYFQLGMEADDDGFIGNPKKVIRILGCSDDDLKILLSKRFVIIFESGVLVVKHHRINNNYDKHNSRRTVYLEEFNKLFIKENKAYTLDGMQGIPAQSDYRLKPVFRLEENRIDKNTSVAEAPHVVEILEEDEEKTAKPDKRIKDKEAVYRLFSKTKQPWMFHKQQRLAALRLFDLRGLEKIAHGVEIMRENNHDPFCPQAFTPFQYEEKLPALNSYIKKHGL